MTIENETSELGPILSPEEKLDIVEKNPKVVHLTPIENLEGILDSGVLSPKMAQKAGLPLSEDWGTVTQEALDRMDGVSVFDEKTGGINWRDPDYALPAFNHPSEHWRIAIFANPAIERQQLDWEKDQAGWIGESLVKNRIKPEQIYAIGVESELAEKSLEEFMKYSFSDEENTKRLAIRLSKSPHLSDRTKEKLAAADFIVELPDDEKFDDYNKVILEVVLEQHLEAATGRRPDKLTALDYVNDITSEHKLKTIIYKG